MAKAKKHGTWNSPSSPVGAEPGKTIRKGCLAGLDDELGHASALPISLPGICCGSSHRFSEDEFVTSDLFTTSRSWRQPRCPSLRTEQGNCDTCASQKIIQHEAVKLNMQKAVWIDLKMMSSEESFRGTQCYLCSLKTHSHSK